MIPAISIFPVDTSAIVATRMAKTLGGMIGSRLAPASTVPAENWVSYPRARMAGNSERPKQAGDRHGGARERTKDRRKQDADDILAAAESADQSIERVEQHLHRSRAEHDLAHGDEERNRRQNAGRGGRIDAVRKQSESSRPEQDEHAGHVHDEERREQRHSQRHQEQEERDRAEDDHPPGHATASSVRSAGGGSNKRRRK